MSSAAAAICDGGGCSRTIEALAERRGLLRPATLDDVRRVWEWRYANGASEFYRNPERPDYPDHEEWFARALADRRRIFLIFCRDGIPLAHVRFDSDPDDPRVAHISICVACEARGQGIGTRAIRSAISATALRYSKIIAEVHEGNTVSRRTFARLGFEDAGNDGPFRRLVLCPFGERGRLRA